MLRECLPSIVCTCLCEHAAAPLSCRVWMIAWNVHEHAQMVVGSLDCGECLRVCVCVSCVVVVCVLVSMYN